ncbi:MAG: Eco57I restriction-modification methylase domain-containing protein, partial [Aridibacter sp.]
HDKFLEFIYGIDSDRDRRWYASVILNRLMFIYFLQEKRFLDDGKQRYLQSKLEDSKANGTDLYFKEFLWKLFFVGFAKPENERNAEDKQLLGDIPYLNGGLFLPHRIEIDYKDKIQISDEAFENIFKLFQSYSWNLDDTPGGKADEINPDVLGYIFEKYINQKAFGAYYTRPEITQYLCEQTIYKLILDQVNSLAKPPDGQTPNMFSSNDGGLFLERTYDSMADLLLYLDEFLCRKLWFNILPDLKLLDPACGSGAFLVAALKTLLNVYSAIIGKMETLGDKGLKDELDIIHAEHPSINYYIKKRIITNNLYGVDIMEEGTEIAKLRLFMTLVSSVHHKEELEPLPNIDFNILVGNSLIGILNVNAEGFEKVVGRKQANLFDAQISQSYQTILDDKNKSIELYKNHTFKAGENAGLDQNTRLLQLREHIDKIRQDSYDKLNQLLLGDFNDLKIKFEQATWDANKKKEGKPEKRDLTIADIEALQPFHWGFEFDRILNKNGNGFDAIITNPPWEVFQTDEKEFFQEFVPNIQKNKIRIEDWKKQFADFMKEDNLREHWLKYSSSFLHVSKFFKTSPQYKNQISIINGKNTGSKINLYNLFIEQSHSLLRKNGRCGIIVQGGIYSDLGSTRLREMLFSENRIDKLFGLSNERFIFENVDHRQTFCILVFAKGGMTEDFDASFRINPREAVSKDSLEHFLKSPKEHIKVSFDLIKKLSPNSFSVMEFKNELDIQIAEKTAKFPLLSEKIDGKWSFKLSQDFNMTIHSYLFKTSDNKDNLPLYEGRMIHQFLSNYSKPRYWVDEKEGRKVLIGRESENQQLLDYQKYKFAYRAIARNTDSRTLIGTVLPPNVFCGNSISFALPTQNSKVTLLICGLLNSLSVDFALRQQVSANLNMFYLYQLPVPRLTERDEEFMPIVERTAKLICTTPKFDDLAKEVGLGSHKNGVTDETERQNLRAELDALVAHLYGLTEEEFTYILTTFPLVSEPVKVATQNAFRDAERGLIK